ncbi:hypothetical protein ACP4OV_002506 [Aristida adscensionis]
MAYGKRSRQQVEETAALWLPDGADMARMLMLFSGHHQVVAAGGGGGVAAPERVFECKTCNRQFPSFQALGGHRASHKKPRMADDAAAEPPKPKVHGCSICGLEFAIGQALGGHMRRHRAVEESGAALGVGLGLSLGGGLGPRDDGKKTTATAAAAELVLDLNVPATPEEEPDRDSKFGHSVEVPVAVDFSR